jgi:hypothetical protein
MASLTGFEPPATGQVPFVAVGRRGERFASAETNASIAFAAEEITTLTYSSQCPLATEIAHRAPLSGSTINSAVGLSRRHPSGGPVVRCRCRARSTRARSRSPSARQFMWNTTGVYLAAAGTMPAGDIPISKHWRLRCQRHQLHQPWSGHYSRAFYSYGGRPTSRAGRSRLRQRWVDEQPQRALGHDDSGLCRFARSGGVCCDGVFRYPGAGHGFIGNDPDNTNARAQSEVVREVGVHDFRMATKHQLLHRYDCLLGVSPGAVGVDFRRKIGFEDRL